MYLDQARSPGPDRPIYRTGGLVRPLPEGKIDFPGNAGYQGSTVELTCGKSPDSDRVSTL